MFLDPPHSQLRPKIFAKLVSDLRFSIRTKGSAQSIGTLYLEKCISKNMLADRIHRKTLSVTKAERHKLYQATIVFNCRNAESLSVHK